MLPDCFSVAHHEVRGEVMHHDVQLSMNDCVLRVHTRARGGGAADGKNTVLLASFPFLLEENTHWPTSCRGYTKQGVATAAASE